MVKLKSAALGIAIAAMAVSNLAIAQDTASGSFDLHAMLSAVSAMYGFDPALLEAIATIESHDDPTAISPAGAKGLMQLMPATAARFLAEDPFDPVQNALGAARFLCYLKRDARIRNDLPDLLAAYNAGERAVERYNGVPPYPETREYVRRVLWLYLLGGPPSRWKIATEETAPAPRRRVLVEQPKRHKRMGLQDGDSIVLKQLTDLRRQRAEAAAATSIETTQ